MSLVTVPEPQKIRRSGNSYVVTIPKDLVERLGLNEHDLVQVQLQLIDVVPRMRPELKEADDAVWKRHEAGLRYLADR